MSSPPTGPVSTTPKAPTKAQRRRLSIVRLKRTRAIVQLGFAAFIIVAAVKHQVAKASGAASVDAICPFGAVETLWTWVTTGNFISKIHPSNIVLGVAVLVSVFFAGNAFCGWICPFGAVQDALSWVRRKLHLPTVTVSRRLERVLRWGRFVVLAAVIWGSVATAQLVFAEYDPYVTLFSLHWLFEFSWEALWVALLITVVTLGISLFVERAWCTYACPFGAVFTVLGHLSFLRIRRNADRCTDCTICDRACPMGIQVMETPHQKGISTDCVGCLDCVAECPVPGALEVKAGPTWLGSIGVGREEERVPSRAASSRRARTDAHRQPVDLADRGCLPLHRHDRGLDDRGLVAVERQDRGRRHHVGPGGGQGLDVGWAGG